VVDDLEAKLDRLLSSPDSLKRVEELMAGFAASPPASLPSAEPAAPSDGLPDIAQLMKLLPLFEQWGKGDDQTALLRALRPHLQDGRRKRLDDAEKMLRLMKLLPLIKELQKEDAHEE